MVCPFSDVWAEGRCWSMNALFSFLLFFSLSVFTSGEGTSDDSVKVAAAGGNGFVVRCGLPQRQAAYR